MKLFRLLLLSLAASLVFGQSHQDENSTQWSPVTLAGEFLEHDFVNWFGYVNGVYDSYAPISRNTGTTNNGSFGWEVGGGVSATHAFRDGDFSLSYRGDYRDYQNSFYSTGTDQNLGLSYIKRLTRRWTLSTSLGGGISFYGGTFFSAASNATTIVPNNPFSSETRYLSAGANISYQQSRRLSYVVGGSYFLQRYNFQGAISSQGGSGSGSVLYRTSVRTTVGATYSHGYFSYQGSSGTANSDTIQATVSHVFPNHWTGSLAGGVTHSTISGIAQMPVFVINGGTLGPGGYVPGQYHQSTSFPSFSGTVGRAYRHSNVYASAGQGISAGNGYYLASKTLYVNGVYSVAIQRRQNVSFAGGYNRLSSVANTVAVDYSSSSLSASYGVNVIRYVGLNARYDYIHYGSLNPNPSINDNRLSFGVTFSSKSIPLTLF